MRAEVWPGSPAADHVTMLNTLGALGLLLVLLVLAIAGVLFVWDRANAAARADDFTADFTPHAESPRVVEYVEAVDAGMKAGQAARTGR
jgi:hypothetical protein